MNKKIATWVGIIILLIIVISAFYFVKKAQNISDTSSESQTATLDNGTNNEQAAPIAFKTVIGMVIAVGEKEIAISNGTSEPDLSSISSNTPVVKIGADQKEIVVGLAEVKAGDDARITIKSDSDPKKPEAEKIYLVRKK